MDADPHKSVAEALRQYGSANVGDALRALGKHFQSMEGAIRPLAVAMKTAGPVFTVRCYPGATWAIEQALELAPSGSVLVVDGGGRDDLILMGGLMSRRAQQRGIAGAIIDAAVRDVDEVIAMNFPMFSRGVSPRGGTFAEIGEWQTTICCGRVPVTPGDWVVADSSGAVVIPGTMLDTTLAKAASINQRESQIDVLLQTGLSLGDAAARHPMAK